MDKLFEQLRTTTISGLDLLPHDTLAEKIIELQISGIPRGLPASAAKLLREIKQKLTNQRTDDLHVVLFGGGTGLSNIIGGDSRSSVWPDDPFGGLKQTFPNHRSIICVTDDGGSTGELCKDLPLVALGDIRHVLISSIQKARLQHQYALDDTETLEVARIVHRVFNFRTNHSYTNREQLACDLDVDFRCLPKLMADYLNETIVSIFAHDVLKSCLTRPHCLGNLILVSAIYNIAQSNESPPNTQDLNHCIIPALDQFCKVFGISEHGVLPCCTTPARLQFMYRDGTLVTGEYKSGHARRHHAVHQIFVEYSNEPRVPQEVLTSIQDADIIVFAPGSLFSSVIPIFQVPAVANAVRQNSTALKVLVSNLWAQAGETDVGYDDPARRYHVSDLIQAYHRNIPGGIEGLFDSIVVLGLHEISGRILQQYAVEDKVPIYLDRANIAAVGIDVLEAGFFCQRALIERNVIQHDPWAMAVTIRTLWQIRDQHSKSIFDLPAPVANNNFGPIVNRLAGIPCERYRKIIKRISELDITGLCDDTEHWGDAIVQVLWRHADIHVDHLQCFHGIEVIERIQWLRNQEWDNIYSYFDPSDRVIKICKDEIDNDKHFEFAVLVAIGESLLGDYSTSKSIEPLIGTEAGYGSLFQFSVNSGEQRKSFIDDQQLAQYLSLARMNQSASKPSEYSRLINGDEGFTPPGLLFGLLFAWYLDNRLAAHIDYKMAIMRHPLSALVPEQVKTARRRAAMIQFFRTAVFRYTSPQYATDPIVDRHSGGI